MLGVYMRKEKNIFNEQNKEKSSSLKYFLIAFSVFIVLLSICSAFLFMKSIDFDFNNLVGASEEDSSLNETETQPAAYSVSKLEGKSDLLFIITDDNEELIFSSIISTDFNNKTMSVKTLDRTVNLIYENKSFNCAALYKSYDVEGLKKALNNEYVISKYVECTESQFKDILSLFADVTVNVTENIDYRSSEFNLELDAGKQALSEDYLYKYLLVSNDYNRSLIICDIINSLLTPQNAENSDSLFKDFVNSSKTDISIIDYSNSIEKIKVYSNASDKFLPVAVK